VTPGQEQEAEAPRQYWKKVTTTRPPSSAKPAVVPAGMGGDEFNAETVVREKTAEPDKTPEA
jgi:hypothetical protein